MLNLNMIFFSTHLSKCPIGFNVRISLVVKLATLWVQKENLSNIERQLFSIETVALLYLRYCFLNCVVTLLRSNMVYPICAPKGHVK